MQKSGAEGDKRREINTAAIMKEACDNVSSQVEERLSKSDHFIAAKLINCTLFPRFVKSFPEAELECAVHLWPLTNKIKLKTELSSLYQHSKLSKRQHCN